MSPEAPSGSTRRTPRGLVVASLALGLACVGAAIHERRHPVVLADRVSWRDLSTGTAEGRITGKPVLYDFTADWCQPCRKMTAEVFAHPRSADVINERFVPVRIMDGPGDDPPDVAALRKRHDVTGFPTLVVVAPDGETTLRLVGYRNRATTMDQLVRASLVASRATE